ncbi:MAG TPA: transglutaminase domain-containing protein [Lacipirellulaceae bacterium]
MYLLPALTIVRATLLAAITLWCAVEPSAAATEPDIQALIADGSFAEAERLLKERIADPSAPVTSEAAIQLEILRRTRSDFPHSDEEILAQLQKIVPDATLADVARWREAGDLQYRRIDGEVRYFRQAAANLFRFNDEARRRRRGASAEKKFDLNGHLEQLVVLSETAATAEVYPVKHKVRYELAVKQGNPRLKAGATVRAWLPFPQEYRQQREVKLIRCEPADGKLSDNGSSHRTVYFEHRLSDLSKPPRFRVEFEFITSAYCPKLDAETVRPYDPTSALYREYTAERPPHIVFTPEVKRLAREIVGAETNPLEKALRVFRWVSANVPWCSEMEYSIIPNLSQKGIAARRGDCGVQGMVFITLCRAAGIPARWQSGWQTKPGDWNMHDWSEYYVEPWGWLPADASYGVRDHEDPRVRDFFCGHLDPYRLIVNLDYARELQPSKISFRSEPNDFQRGEIEIDGHNLYFDEWDWTFRVETSPVSETARTRKEH